MQAEREASLVPAGMRLLPEEERLEMLSLLETSKDETEAKIRVRQNTWTLLLEELLCREKTLPLLSHCDMPLMSAGMSEGPLSSLAPHT